MKALGRRIGRIEARERVPEAEHGPSHLIVMPDGWPTEDCRAYDELVEADDFAAWADLLEKHAGRRPGPRTRVVALRLRSDGPP